MNRKQHDIDKLFAQVRAEATPPALETLIQTQPSGALVSAKKGASLFSGKALSNFLWKALALGGVGVAGTVLYFSMLTSVSDSDVQTALPQTASTEVELPRGKAAQPSPAPQQQHAPSAANASAGLAAEQQRSIGDAAAGANTPSALQQRALQHAPTQHAARSRAHKATERSRITNTPTSKHSPTKRTIQSAEQARTTLEERALPARETLAAVTRVPLLSSAMNLHLSTPFSAAQEEFPLEWQEGESNYNASLLLDGFSLFSDVLQIAGEFRAGSRMSYGILFGVGNIQGAQQDTSFALVVAGAQFSYYAIGDFNEGLHIGAQLLYSSVDARAKRTLYDYGNTIALAPYAGYKLLFFDGLTINAQAGVSAVSPPLFLAPAEQMSTSQLSQWRIAPRMQIGIGWSF